MLPLRLSLTNFLSWQHMSSPLDLNGIGLACLCGDNGHGKSALLDATTWVLWGESRAERQEDLIYQGAREMSVELVFLAHDQEYKAIRKHIAGSRGRQGKTELELLHVEGSTQTPITGNSVRDTESIIKELLNMDYSTFINTSFLMQGKADQFATSKPTERKILLADVLDLRKYDRISERARVRAREYENNENKLSGELERLNDEISATPRFQLMAETASRNLQQITDDLDLARKNVATLQEQRDQQQTALQELEESLQLISTLTDNLEQNSRARSQLRERIETNQGILNRRTAIENDYKTLQQQLNEVTAMEIKRESFELLTDQVQKVRHKLDVEKERLKSQASVLQNRISRELEPRTATIPTIEASLSRLNNQKLSLDAARSKLEEKSESLSKLLTDLQHNRMQETNMVTLAKENTAKLDLLSVSGALCPLCGDELKEVHRKEIRSQLEREQEYVEEKREGLKTHLHDLEIQESQLSAKVEEMRLAINDQRRKIDTATAEAQVALESAKEANITLEEVLVELQGIDSALKLESYAEKDRSTLNSLTQEIVRLAYDGTRHREINLLIQNPGATYQRNYDELQYANDALTTDQDIYENLTLQGAQLTEKLQTLRGKMANPTVSPDDLSKSINQLNNALSNVDQLQKQSAALSLELHEANWQLERIDKLKSDQETTGFRLSELQHERNIFQELSTTFGKNGLQAYMIDEALPELEYEAAELLSRLTNNRMSVKLETQRERRSSKGPPRETLDILVADEKGTRPYELFSGGEAFRVNFALRIALSRMLARRAGSPLPTLFIDEGFGTQDAEGRSLLIESINTIREDFKCILVVTHIDEIKDAFPFRIEILKTEEAGSTFTIN